MKKFLKLSLLSCIAMIGLLAFMPVQVHAGRYLPGELMNTWVGTGAKGSTRATSGYTQVGNVIQINVTGSKGTYVGHANDGHFVNPVCTGMSATQAVLNAGVSMAQIQSYMQASGIVDVNGNWKTLQGEIVNVIDIMAIKGLQTMPVSLNPVVIIPPPPTPPKAEDRWVHDGTKTFLRNISIDGEWLYLVEETPEHRANSVFIGEIGDSSHVSDSKGFHPGDPAALYEGDQMHGRVHSFELEDDKAVGAVDFHAEFEWIIIDKYHLERRYYNHEGAHECGDCWIDSREVTDTHEDGTTSTHTEYFHTNPGAENWTHWHHMGIYKYEDHTETDSRDHADMCDIYQPTYYERYPIDLTTCAPFSGDFIITNLGCPVKAPEAIVHEGAALEIIEKNGQTHDIAGEEFKIVGNNTPSSFSIKWLSDLFGVKQGSSPNYPGYGPTSPENITFSESWHSKGHHNIVSGYMLYGSDSHDVDRDPQISSVTEPGSTGNNEVMGGGLYGVDGPGQVPHPSEQYLMRNILSAETGEHYDIGTNGNEAWVTVFEKKVDNLRGEKVIAVASDTPHDCDMYGAHEFNEYDIYDYFMQPVLHGDYSPLNAAGMKDH